MNQNLIPWGESYQNVSPAREIFVVDDDENMRDILASTLATEGFPVTTFEDGDSFLRAASKRVPICVFLDIVMPRRSGLEILRELRARHYWTPVFITSALDDFPTVVEAMKCGAHDYIRKPFDQHAPALRVRSAVEAWLRREGERSALHVQGPENCEWFRLTPGEREMLLLIRLMDVKNEHRGIDER
jgi:two-component system, LuxR family, response regulator FixJ